MLRLRADAPFPAEARPAADMATQAQADQRIAWMPQTVSFERVSVAAIHVDCSMMSVWLSSITYGAMLP
jgi:hypothetical protein